MGEPRYSDRLLEGRDHQDPGAHYVRVKRRTTQNPGEIE